MFVIYLFGVVKMPALIQEVSISLSAILKHNPLAELLPFLMPLLQSLSSDTFAVSAVLDLLGPFFR